MSSAPRSPTGSLIGFCAVPCSKNEADMCDCANGWCCCLWCPGISQCQGEGCVSRPPHIIYMSMYCWPARPSCRRARSSYARVGSLGCADTTSGNQHSSAIYLGFSVLDHLACVLRRQRGRSSEEEEEGQGLRCALARVPGPRASLGGILHCGDGPPWLDRALNSHTARLLTHELV